MAIIVMNTKQKRLLNSFPEISDTVHSESKTKENCPKYSTSMVMTHAMIFGPMSHDIVMKIYRRDCIKVRFMKSPKLKGTKP